jgi:hypothetical protein
MDAVFRATNPSLSIEEQDLIVNGNARRLFARRGSTDAKRQLAPG